MSSKIVVALGCLPFIFSAVAGYEDGLPQRLRRSEALMSKDNEHKNAFLDEAKKRKMIESNDPTESEKVGDVADRELLDLAALLFDNYYYKEMSIPTSVPSWHPSSEPSASPSSKPSNTPTSTPSASPSIKASNTPTSTPSASPSSIPTAMPSTVPSSTPTDTRKCGISEQERRDRLTAIFLEVSGITELVIGTPQYAAAEWMIEENIAEDCCVCPGDPNVVQRYILAVFYYTTDGDNWEKCSAPNDLNDPADVAAANANCERSRTLEDPFQVPTFFDTKAWLTCANECLWGGVECVDTSFCQDPKNSIGQTPSTCVDRIEFERNNLDGTIATELQRLTDMRYLLLQRMSISGTIPTQLGILPLVTLDLNVNQVTGTIPTELFNASHFFLQLDLDTNCLTGGIPTEIGIARFLQFIQVQGNRLDGAIPTEIGLLNDLGTAEFFSNRFTGSMPDEVCDLVDAPGAPIVGIQNLTKLTSDCNEASAFFIECACCSECPVEDISCLGFEENAEG